MLSRKGIIEDNSISKVESQVGWLSFFHKEVLRKRWRPLSCIKGLRSREGKLGGRLEISPQKRGHCNPGLGPAALRLGWWLPSLSRARLCCILKVMEKLVKCDPGSGGFSSLLSAVLEKQTLSATAVWQLLLEQKTKSCPLNLLLEQVRREPGADAFFQAGTHPDLCHGLAVTRSCYQADERKSFLLIIHT